MFFILFVLVICRLLRIAWLDSRRFCFSIYPHVNKSKYLTAILKSVWQRICSQLSLAQKAYLLMRLLYVCKFLKVFSLFIHLRAQFTLILLENLGLGIIQIKLNNCPIIGGEWGPSESFISLCRMCGEVIDILIRKSCEYRVRWIYQNLYHSSIWFVLLACLKPIIHELQYSTRKLTALHTF